MPHSTNDPQDSRVHKQSGLRLVTSHSAFPVNARSAGGGLGSAQSTATLDSKWRRASLSTADAYSDLANQRARTDAILSASPRQKVNGMPTTNGTPAAKPRTQPQEDRQQNMARDRIARESPVIAELRTNVIIKDEYTLVTDLSYHLAVRYSKPDSSIMINIDHSSCLALGGTFDPCYILTLTTVPAHMGATVNKRNAALIQSFMADILSVPPDRGIIKFVAITEENFAINSNTMLGEVERLEKQNGIETGVKRALNDARKSMPAFQHSAVEPDNKRPNGTIARDDRSEKDKRHTRRRSSMANPPGEVFELAAESDDRPSTSHGPSFAAENGLRMNGISKEDLLASNSRTPNGRPKTIAAQSPSDGIAEAIPIVKPKHISTIVKSEQKSAHMPPSAKPNPGQRPASTTQGRNHSASNTRKNETPLTPVTLKETFVENPKVLKTEPKLDGDTAANTARRRSTISATPKLPPPPPVPESKTLKVSKRKSFLAAFRK